MDKDFIDRCLSIYSQPIVVGPHVRRLMSFTRQLKGVAMKQVLKNHVAILLDVSGSMCDLTNQVKQVFQKQIEFLRKSSLLFEQETRVSIYTFGGAAEVKCLISDVDVARPMEIERLTASGNTPLLDACGLSIEDFKLLPQKYGDHSFIVYVLTDGEENTSRKYSYATFKALLKSLPDNFSFCALAPTKNAMKLLEGAGIPPGNIDRWDTTEKGIEEVGQKFEQSMNNYYTARSKGVRSMSNVFSGLTPEKLKERDLQHTTKELSTSDYTFVKNEEKVAVEIRPLCLTKVSDYKIGNAYYELVKRETIQKDKIIAVRNKVTGKLYLGFDARHLLGLPDDAVKVDPVVSPDWIVYVQSTSVNRKVIPFQTVLYIF